MLKEVTPGLTVLGVLHNATDPDVPDLGRSDGG